MSTDILSTAAMLPALRTPVPSRGLLRFLRAQTECEAALFSATSRAVRPSLGAPSPCRRACVSHSNSKRTARAFSTACPRRVAVPEPFHGKERSPRRIPKRDSLRDAKALFGTTSVARKHPDTHKSNAEAGTSWQERLWGKSAATGGKPLKPNDLPSHNDSDGTLFTSGRSVSAKALLEPRLRCTEVDEAGKVILVDGEFKKMELIAKVRIFPRQIHD